MTIQEALIAINAYPIPVNLIEKITTDRALIPVTTYTAVIGLSQSYRLATADVFLWLYGQPSITEQEVGINQALGIKKGFLDAANIIYKEYDDPKYSGVAFGMIGENWNG